MRIAVTRVAEKAGDDAALFKEFGHEAKIISPLAAELHTNIVQQFVLAANDRQFDAIFFTSAYPAEVCAP
ncbi:MAG: uroporphyrinogen-III synthase, partial [Methanocorpusculum sp.]|nr:uroporphyrinogen-III synthase [Methanocorpusculum sp.]